MTEFEITIEDKTYSGHIITFGYGYKIVLFIEDIPVVFEPDEERTFRAVVPPDQMDKINPKLLGAIADELEINLKN